MLKRAMLFVGCIVVCVVSMPQVHAAEPRLPTVSDWLQHVEADLMPFWDLPDALGVPVGNFPGWRCNDGRMSLETAPCKEAPPPDPFRYRQSTVGISRQIYLYGVAFHLTGKPEYLQYARVGLSYLLENAIDSESRLFFSHKDLETGQWGPPVEQRRAMRQAYGLLGPVFMYYLTRDPALLERIVAIRTALFAAYRDPASGSFKRRPGDGGPSVYLTSHLDQLNAYQLLLTANVPEPYHSVWLSEAVQTARYVRAQFFDEGTGLFRTAVGPMTEHAGKDPEIWDLGLSAKAFWFLHMVGIMAGDGELTRFALRHTDFLFDKAFDVGARAWVGGYREDGSHVVQVPWWVFAELNQYAGALAIDSPRHREKLAHTYTFWRHRYVDPAAGGVWAAVDVTTGQPLQSPAKHWEWKAGYHELQHALVSAIVAASIHRQRLTLYFAFNSPQPGTAVRTPKMAYMFYGAVTSVEERPTGDGSQIQRIEFDGLSFARPSSR